MYQDTRIDLNYLKKKSYITICKFFLPKVKILLMQFVLCHKNGTSSAMKCLVDVSHKYIINMYVILNPDKLKPLNVLHI